MLFRSKRTGYKGDASFASLVANHNPIYYLAERTFFSNKAAKDNPRFLYPPFHRDQLCRIIMEHILEPPSLMAALVLLAFRYGYKSTFNHGAVPLWYALRRKHLDDTDALIVLRHHKEQMASANLVRIKNQLRYNEWLNRVWAQACPAESKQMGHSTAFTLPRSEERRGG